MSVTKTYGKFVFVCDSCQDELETAETEWHAAVLILRKEGWQYEKVGRDYKHHCPDCA